MNEELKKEQIKSVIEKLTKVSSSLNKIENNISNIRNDVARNIRINKQGYQEVEIKEIEQQLEKMINDINITVIPMISNTLN